VKIIHKRAVALSANLFDGVFSSIKIISYKFCAKMAFSLHKIFQDSLYFKNKRRKPPGIPPQHNQKIKDCAVF